MNNHRLTIRLDDQDLDKIQALKDNQSYKQTTNSIIRLALTKAFQLDELLTELRDVFHATWTADQKALKKLNEKYGILQRNLF